MNKSPWIRAVLVALTALVIVLGSDTLAVAVPHARDASHWGGNREAGRAGSALGLVAGSDAASSSARTAGSDDGIVAESMWASSLAVPDHGCGTVTYGMSLAASGTTSVGHWSANVAINGPDGDGVAGTWLFGSTPSDSLFLCATDDLPGTYVAVATWSAYDESSQLIDQGTDTVSFTFSVGSPAPKARQRLTVHAYPWGQHGWRITGTLTRGGHRRAHVKVYVDAIIRGRGYDLFGARTNARGVATWRFRPKKGAARYKFALHAPEDDTSAVAWSRTFRLPHRG